MKHYPNIGEVKYRTSAKARRVNITVSREGEVRVSMPVGFPFSIAEKFVLSKESWILKCKAKLVKKIETNKTIFTEETEFRTKTRKLNIIRENRTNGKLILLDDTLDVYVPNNIDIKEQSIQDIIIKSVEHAWKEEAHNILPKRLEILAKRNNFIYSQLTIKRVKTFWGKCTSSKAITLNTYLMNIPDHLIDYVILHELCHTKHMNHGKNFWALLDQVCETSAKSLNKEMKQYNTRFF